MNLQRVFVFGCVVCIWLCCVYLQCVCVFAARFLNAGLVLSLFACVLFSHSAFALVCVCVCVCVELGGVCAQKESGMILLIESAH